MTAARASVVRERKRVGMRVCALSRERIGAVRLAIEFAPNATQFDRLAETVRTYAALFGSTKDGENHSERRAALFGRLSRTCAR